MEYIYSKNLKPTNNIHDEFNILNLKHNNKSFKIKPRNIFNNNKLFAYKKASGNVKLLKKLIHKIFIKKYFHDINFYYSKIIDDILNNKSTHLVAEFKDYLIYGDDSEFLHYNYTVKDSRKYLPKIFKYYESCSVIFPNYVILHESKYLYKNIQRKQRIIDMQQELEEKNKKIKERQDNKEDNSGENIAINLFNTTEIYSILKETNTSNINKIFGVNNNIKSINADNDKENENSELILNNIINELKKVDSKKTFRKKKINLFKNKFVLPSLTINNSKGLNKNNKIYINRTIINKQNSKYLNSENNNIMKYNKIIKKSLTKRNEGDKSTSNLILKKKKERKYLKERKKLLSNENLNTYKYYKIPRSKLSVDINAIKKHKKIKSTINEQDLINKKGLSFFNCILKKKTIKRKTTNYNTNIYKFSTKTKKTTNSFIPSQKNLLQEKNKIKNFYICKSTKRRNEHLNKINYSSSPNIIKKQANIKSHISLKVPMIFIKDSNSTTNIVRNNININNLSSSRSRSIIRKRKIKKENDYLHENNYNENYTYNQDIMSEPNINTLPITDREKDTKKIFFTFAPNVNNVINLNKIKHILKNIRNTNISNISNQLKNSINKSKSIQNNTNKKENIINKKNVNSNRNILINKKKSNSFKSSYNTQISSSLCTACSFGKNSHLIDIETIKIYKKRKSPNSIRFKAKSNKEKNKAKYNNISKRKFSLSPDKVESKQIIKKMLINNAKLNSKKLKKYRINKRFSKVGQNKRQKNIVLPIRKEKEKEVFEIKTKDMIHLLLNNKLSSDNLGKISRNSKTKNSNNEKSILTFSNKTQNSINLNSSNKKALLSIKSYKSTNKNNKNIFK